MRLFIGVIILAAVQSVFAFDKACSTIPQTLNGYKMTACEHKWSGFGTIRYVAAFYGSFNSGSSAAFVRFDSGISKKSLIKGMKAAFKYNCPQCTTSEKEHVLSKLKTVKSGGKVKLVRSGQSMSYSVDGTVQINSSSRVYEAAVKAIKYFASGTFNSVIP